MQLSIYQDFLITFCLFFCVICGMFLGFNLKSHRDLQKQNKFQFFKIDSGILRLDTSTGSVSLIKSNTEIKEILYGKKRTCLAKNHPHPLGVPLSVFQFHEGHRPGGLWGDDERLLRLLPHGLPASARIVCRGGGHRL